jgi:tetratricopeptide (TPR) repeat protein
LTLENRYAWLVLAGLWVAGVTALLIDHRLGILTFFVMVAVESVVWRLAWHWMWRRAGRRHVAAFEREDVDAALRTLDTMVVRRPSPAFRAWLAFERASVSMLHDRWHEAVVALRAVDRDALSEPLRQDLDNNLAWALAHDGAEDEAVALARTVVERARADASVPVDARAAYIGTLGVALVRRGAPAPGLELLREALALGGTPRMQAMRYLFVGDAQRALGREDAEREAYLECIRAAPSSRSARAAAERLSSAPKSPYR